MRTLSLKITPSKLLNQQSLAISGFKHAIVVLIAATIAHPHTTFHFKNVPNIADVKILTQILTNLGAQVFLSENTLTINTRHLNSKPISQEFCQPIHGAIYLLPALLARFGNAELFECGGCQIGDNRSSKKRPINHMFSILKNFGYECKLIDEKISAFCKELASTAEFDIMEYSNNPNMLTGPHISGATKTALLASMTPHPTTVIIKNPYPKPDVTQLLHLMRLLKYQVNEEGNLLTISRDWREEEPKKIEFTVINDLSEIITYICLAVFNKIELTLDQLDISAIQIGLKEEFNLLTQMGIPLMFDKNTLKIGIANRINPLKIQVTSTGIYSDHQPFFALLLSMAQEKSSIEETVWKNRFSYAKELIKLGFEINIKKNKIEIDYSPNLIGSNLHAEDLRAAAVLIIAALKGKGITHLTGIEHLERGYTNFIPSLQTFGAKIETISL